MKNNNLILLLAGLFLLVSFIQLTSACKHNDYNDLQNDYSLKNGDDVIFIIQNVDYSEDYDSHYWENEDRFPVYDYREGYSYRSTRAYQEFLDEKDYRNAHYIYSYNYEESISNYNSRNYNFNEAAEYYYTYDNYMRTYTKHECYQNPPKDKLFYIKCP